jgi:hypothetical protein
MTVFAGDFILLFHCRVPSKTTLPVGNDNTVLLIKDSLLILYGSNSPNVQVEFAVKVYNNGLDNSIHPYIVFFSSFSLVMFPYFGKQVLVLGSILGKST